jgi:hypothetical protein
MLYGTDLPSLLYGVSSKDYEQYQNLQRLFPESSQVDLTNGNGKEGNKDVVLKYSLQV